MDTYLSLEFSHRDELPTKDSNIRTPHALVEHFIESYTTAGDRVLDIFAGFGTTLTVADRLDRTPYGIEYEYDRANWIRKQLSQPENIRHGDVRNLDSSWFPTIDCCFTSPPFMEEQDERDPFQNYADESTYDDYLDDIESAFSRLDTVLTPGGHVIIDIANMKHQNTVTTLAWDVADRVSTIFDFDGEVVITWTPEESGSPTDKPSFGYGYDHSYCLIFTKPSA